MANNKEPSIALRAIDEPATSKERPEVLNGHRHGEEEGVEYPQGLKLGLIILGLCLSVFCMALDSTIIATAIPRITDEFDSLQDIGWYGSAYLLTTCSFQLFFGKLYSRFNIKLVYLLALLLFEVGSLICALAPDSTALIIGRAIAGLGAAGIFSGVLLIIAHSTPVYKRPVYTGIAGAMYGLASVVAPLLGGVFTDRVTWRWCFYINLPMGAVTAVVIILFLRYRKSSDSQQKLGVMQGFWQLDPIGTILFVPGIICLLLALQWGGTTFAWSDARIIALLVLFAVLMVAFTGVQLWLQEMATVPPRIMGQRTIATSFLFGFLLGAAFFLLTYFLPVWFQAIKATDALQSGIDCIPLILTMALGGIISGGLTTKFGYYMPFVIVSPVLTSIGIGLMTTFAPDTDTGKWIGYQILFGFGCGIAFQVPQIAAQTVLPLKDVPQGVSITFFAETLGGAIFVSAGNNILNNNLVKYIGALNIPQVNPYTIVELGATELRGYVPVAFVAQTVTAYNQALINVFQVALIVACLSVIGAAGMEWKSVHNPIEKVEDAELVPRSNSSILESEPRTEAASMD